MRPRAAPGGSSRAVSPGETRTPGARAAVAPLPRGVKRAAQVLDVDDRVEEIFRAPHRALRRRPGVRPSLTSRTGVSVFSACGRGQDGGPVVPTAWAPAP